MEFYHSAKGSTWSKKRHKYIYKVMKNGRVVYVYVRKNGEIYDDTKGHNDTTYGLEESKIIDVGNGNKTMVRDGRVVVDLSDNTLYAKSYEKALMNKYGDMTVPSNSSTPGGYSGNIVYYDARTGEEISKFKVNMNVAITRAKNFLGWLF